MRLFVNSNEPLSEQQCAICGTHSRLIASHLRVCGQCIRQRADEARPFIEQAHAKAREEFAMTAEAPHAEGGFVPHFFMPDLPCTSVNHAEKAETAAREAGLTNIRVGNRHLLSREY